MQKMKALMEEIVSNYRLPPNMTLKVLEDDFGHLFIEIKGVWDDATGRHDKVETTRRVHVFDEYLVEGPEALLRMVIEDTVRDIWAHELDEWLTYQGVHIRDPHPELNRSKENHVRTFDTGQHGQAFPEGYGR